MNPFSFEVSLRLFSTAISADEMCAAVDQPPAVVYVMGEPRKTPTGRLLKGKYKIHYCSFKVLEKQQSDLPTELERICEQLENKQEFFREIRISGGRSELFVGWYSNGNTGAHLDSDLLSKLGALHLDLAVDVYDKSME